MIHHERERERERTKRKRAQNMSERFDMKLMQWRVREK